MSLDSNMNFDVRYAFEPEADETISICPHPDSGRVTIQGGLHFCVADNYGRPYRQAICWGVKFAAC